VADHDQDDTEIAYKNFIKFYFEIKELIAAAEREDGEQRISISAIAELRSALDHIMRAHNVEHELISEDEISKSSGLTPKVYCKKNYEKAYAHLYRAGYDAYDCIAIGIIDEIDKLLDSVSKHALYTVIPGATDTIINPYREAKKLFTSAKIKKDVESHNQERKQFEQYESANGQLCDILDMLNGHARTLIEFDKNYSIIKEIESVLNSVTIHALHTIIPDATNAIVIPFNEVKSLLTTPANDNHQPSVPMKVRHIPLEKLV
jgi:hypothetical protein